MRLKGKTIGILVGPGYEDLEFWVPYMRMLEEGAEVKVIASGVGEIYKSKSGGLTAESHIAAKEITADQLDALLVPGGWAPDKLRRDRNILNLVQEMNAQNKSLGFICHAGWVAASANICKGKRVTGSTGIKDDTDGGGHPGVLSCIDRGAILTFFKPEVRSHALAFFMHRLSMRILFPKGWHLPFDTE